MINLTLDIIINPNNELLVENEITDISNLTEIARNLSRPEIWLQVKN